MEQIRIRFFTCLIPLFWYNSNMPETKRVVSKGKMSDQERQLRSALAKLLSQQGIIHGTLSLRHRVCGKPNCRCADGQKHEGLYLLVRHEGAVRQIYVPKDRQEAVRQWVENYHKARELMDELSGIYESRVRDERS